MQILNYTNVYKSIKSTTIENGIKRALSTGDFGINKINVRVGVAQVLNRMTYASILSHLRRINTPVEKSGKMVPPRKLAPSSWGFLCPVETPEGPTVGVVKNLSVMTHITIISDSSSLYSRTYMSGNGTSATSARGTGEAQGYTTAGTTSNLSNVGLLNIMNYSNATTFKTFIGRENLPASAVQATVGLYRSTSSITTVSFLSPSATATIAVGSVFTLYGIKAA